jgi:chemotaxis protein methyltransferase CheR
MQQVPGGINVPKTPELLRDFEQFKQQLKKRAGLDLDQYKFEQTYRRIYTMMERAGYRKFTDYLIYLASDEARLREFIDRLAINVSELFRNPEQFQILKNEVLPELLRGNAHLKLWSAGSSYGAEAYSLAILLHELAPNRGHQILGTDIDQEVLERARGACLARAICAMCRPNTSSATSAPSKRTGAPSTRQTPCSNAT